MLSGAKECCPKMLVAWARNQITLELSALTGPLSTGYCGNEAEVGAACDIDDRSRSKCQLFLQAAVVE
jgi:hypothetical protein